MFAIEWFGCKWSGSFSIPIQEKPIVAQGIQWSQCLTQSKFANDSQRQRNIQSVGDHYVISVRRELSLFIPHFSVMKRE